jgi:hypothetical protein
VREGFVQAWWCGWLITQHQRSRHAGVGRQSHACATPHLQQRQALIQDAERHWHGLLLRRRRVLSVCPAVRATTRGLGRALAPQLQARHELLPWAGRHVAQQLACVAKRSAGGGARCAAASPTAPLPLLLLRVFAVAVLGAVLCG